MRANILDVRVVGIECQTISVQFTLWDTKYKIIKGCAKDFTSQTGRAYVSMKLNLIC